MWFLPLVSSLILMAPQHDTMALDEHFVDSLHIGKKHHNKVDVSQYSQGDSIYVIIRFYARIGKQWSLKQQIRFRKYDAIDCEPKIDDLNHDGCGDLTCVSLQAARGANEVRRLYVYDKEKDRLVYIINSEKYPNMEYNSYLNCIDAWLVYGGCSTVFLRIHGDRLHQFAWVETIDGYVTAYENTNYGKDKVIKRMKVGKGEFLRYKSYNPLIVY
jgi:hypothetical protein